MSATWHAIYDACIFARLRAPHQRVFRDYFSIDTATMQEILSSSGYPAESFQKRTQYSPDCTLRIVSCLKTVIGIADSNRLRCRGPQNSGQGVPKFRIAAIAGPTQLHTLARKISANAEREGQIGNSGCRIQEVRASIAYFAS
jgi:hypothetical protein